MNVSFCATPEVLDPESDAVKHGSITYLYSIDNDMFLEHWLQIFSL